MADITAANVVLGTADLYIADTSATLPVDATTALAVDFRNMGATTDGVTVTFAPEYANIEVDQVPGSVGARLQSLEVTISTNLAETTLENLRAALSLGDITSTAGTDRFDLLPTNGGEPNYQTLVIDGFGPTGKRVRLIAPKVLSTDEVETVFSKEDTRVFSVTFTAYYVDAETPQVSWLYETVVTP